MNLLDVVSRASPPQPWAEGDNIPWHDPAFSERMLKEHLSQSHDAASRRSEKIAQHVRWLHGAILGGRPGRVLDVACGPGLYTSALARLGHECVGVDYSPASIAYARATAAREALPCSYVEEDVRRAAFGGAYDLALLIYGELNVFSPDDASVILRRICAALSPGGTLVLEPHTFEAVEHIGREGPTWYSRTSGLFSDRPHLVLQECFWDSASSTASIRSFAIDAQTGGVERYAQTMQAYTESAYRAMLEAAGFCAVAHHPSLTGDAGGAHEGLCVVTAGR